MLEEAGVEFAGGLTESEVERAEAAYGFRFPPDLRAFITHALPVSRGWPDWRDVESDEVRRMMSWPSEGVCFDVEHNDFWPSD